MLFTQVEFFICYAFVFLFVVLIQNHRLQKIGLLLVSLYFYAYWDWRFLALLIGSTAVDYSIGRALQNEERPRRRKFLIFMSILFNLGVLGFFKYFNFFVKPLTLILAPLGLHLSTLNIILPIGISFYIFQTLSYTIDVYQKKIEVCRDFLDFALFVTFFPQLIAGPIVRASDFLPQLKKRPDIHLEDVFVGLRNIAEGYFKKVFLADNLAFYVDEVFKNAGAYDGLTSWLAVLSFALQIYFDFSGYSGMAIGFARILGYRLNQNFDFPYIARNMSEFWTRWHISLSSWLKDYLYIPLGGNRKGNGRTFLNLMITMLLGGLWHGASWTFVFWGGIHGLALISQRFAAGKISSEKKEGIATNFLGWIMTFFVINISWVFFRSPTFSSSALMLRQMFFPLPGIHWPYPFALGVIAVTALIHILHLSQVKGLLALRAEDWHTPVIIFSMIWLTLLFPVETLNPFIYFQF